MTIRATRLVKATRLLHIKFYSKAVPRYYITFPYKYNQIHGILSVDSDISQSYFVIFVIISHNSLIKSQQSYVWFWQSIWIKVCACMQLKSVFVRKSDSTIYVFSFPFLMRKLFVVWDCNLIGGLPHNSMQ